MTAILRPLPAGIARRARIAAALCFVLGVSLTPAQRTAHAISPDPVRAALDDAARSGLPAGARLSRLVVGLASLDALPAAETRRRLADLAADRDLDIARRAARALAHLEARPAPATASFAAAHCLVAPAASALAPSAALIEAHRRGLACVTSALADGRPAARVWLPDAEGLVHHVRVPIPSGLRRLHLAATGDLIVSARGPRGHTWLGFSLGLVAAPPVDGLPPEQLTLELPPGTAEVLITLAPRPLGPPALYLFRDGPARPFAPSTTDTKPAPEATANAPDQGPGGAPPPLPTVADDDLFGAAHRRLVGLPDLGHPLEERLGLRSGATAADTAGTMAHRPARALVPRAAELVLALPALTRVDQRASLVAVALLDARTSRDRALLELAAGHLALDRGQLVRATHHLERARASSSDAQATRRLTARIARFSGHPEDALLAYGQGALELAAQDDLPVLDRIELAQAATELGQADLAAALRRRLAAALPGRHDLRAAALSALVASGAVPEALALADELAHEHPERLLVSLDAAERHLAHGTRASLDKARALARQAFASAEADPSPAGADALTRLALLFEALSERRLALEALNRALVDEPQHGPARRHLERLEGQAEVPLTLDPLALAETPVIDPESPFEILGEEIQVRVAPDGAVTRWVRRVLRAQRVPTSRDARTHRVRFDPAQESVTVLSAHLLRRIEGPDGKPTWLREAVLERHVHALTEDWYGLYYDLRQLSVPFDGLASGDLIEVSWRVDPAGQLFSGVTDLFEVLATSLFRHRLRLVVDHPRDLALTHRLSRPPTARGDFDLTSTQSGDRTRLTLVGRDIAPLPVEANAPGTAEVAPVFQLTSFTSWGELARWYDKLIAPSRVVTPAMRELVASLGRGRSKAELTQALASWVTREVRYVGLEFGIHGYRPYRTDEVWARRFGDCKDKATLLTTLLSVAGVDARVTLVRTRKQGRLEGALPSLALFDHAIAWLPERHELVDATAIHHGLSELPRDDQGAQILVLDPQGGSALAISPSDPPARNGLTGRYTVTVDRLGRGGLSAEVTMRGVNAPLYRSLLLEPATRQRRFEEVLNRRYPGLSLSTLDVSDPSDHRRPVDLAFTAEIPRLASRADPITADGNPGLQIPRPAGVDGQLERFAREPTRDLPLVLGPPTRWDLRFRYVFPEGYTATRLPPGGQDDGPFGRYRVTWAADGNTVSVDTELELATDQVAPSDYAALRRFLEGFDRAVAPALVAHPMALPEDPPPVAPTPAGAP